MSADRPAFYTAREVAAKLRVIPHTVSQWAGRGKIPSIKTPGGGQRLYPADVIDAMLAGGTEPTPQPARPRRKAKPADPAPPVPDTPKPPEPTATPLLAYHDAVIQALLDAGIGVRDNEADDSGTWPTLRIELDPTGARTPRMEWRPRTGWSIGFVVPPPSSGGPRVDGRRYLGLGKVPRPDNIARTIDRWTEMPDVLSVLEPFYATEPRGSLDERFTECARRKSR